MNQNPDQRNYLEVLGLENMSLKELLEETEQRKKASSLERQSDRKPILNLTHLVKTAVNTPTQEDYNILMRVYECGGWKWNGGERVPTKEINRWNMYSSNNCVCAGITFNTANLGHFGYSSKSFYVSNNWKVISPQDFYQIQKITPEILNEVNEYFEKKK
ncbi:MAG: hypothetical protein Q7S33_01995 [Nanoarchaeota archaeon]|nr:hypothetical protein [Nanoarchaeota archaeon]